PTKWVTQSKDSNGMIMFYHNVNAAGINNAAPAQLTEITIRDDYLINFKIPSPSSGQTFPLFNYDVSYVNDMILRAPREAIKVDVKARSKAGPVGGEPPEAPTIESKDGANYGWVGASMNIKTMQDAMAAFIASPTTIAAGSDGKSLPQGTLFVD